MKYLLILLTLANPICLWGQSDLADSYHTAGRLLQEGNTRDAYNMLKDIEARCDKEDTIYNYIIWSYAQATSMLEEEYRLKEKFDSSLKYGLEALPLIAKGKTLFLHNFRAREFWMIKNIGVSYFGLGKYPDAKKYTDLLYKAYKDKTLPEGIDSYFNFSFFKLNDKNVWGYEWYPELGDPETKGSFSKIVYYVYNTNPDGSDKDQLYRLHVLKFHKFDNKNIKFDYVLTLRYAVDNKEFSRTLYDYTYDKKIDYILLTQNIKDVVSNIEKKEAKPTEK